MNGPKLPPGWRDGDEKRQELARGFQAARVRDPDDDDPLRAAKGILTWMVMAIVFWLVVAGVAWLVLH